MSGAANYSQIDRKTLALAKIIEKKRLAPDGSIVVVGCGTGREAGVLARYFNVDCIGIDNNPRYFDSKCAAPAKLRVMDAHALKLLPNSCDLIYSFHALEHMAEPEVALRQMARVLKPGGTFVIGTPSSARLVGYIGSGTGLCNILKWNLNDWRMRLQGKWSNDAGAHAGFVEGELLYMCHSAFRSHVLSITHEYYSNLYGDRVANMLRASKISRYIYPCIYVLGKRLE